MGFFGQFIQWFMRLFGIKGGVRGAQDGGDMSSGRSEEVVDRGNIGHEEEGFEAASGPGSRFEDDAADRPEDAPLAGELTHTPRYLWCLDNGHGKATEGKRSGFFADGSQLFEYEFNRALNARIMAKLDEIGVQYFNVVPEVEGDISLSTRAFRANNKSTDLPGGKIYVSIHANANGNSGWDPACARGIETWFYGGSWRGRNIASAFQRALITEMGWKDRFLKFHEPYSKSFYVLRNTSMPAVLLETGFFTCREEAERMRLDEIRDQLATAYVNAILEIERNGIENIDIYHTIYKFN